MHKISVRIWGEAHEQSRTEHRRGKTGKELEARAHLLDQLRLAAAAAGAAAAAVAAVTCCAA